MDDEDVGEDVKEVALRGLSVVAQMKSELVRDGVPAYVFAFSPPD